MLAETKLVWLWIYNIRVIIQIKFYKTNYLNATVTNKVLDSVIKLLIVEEYTLNL